MLDNGEWREVWKTQPIPLLFVSNVIIGDFDGDGKTEIAITPWYDVWVLDAETGELKYKSPFKHPGAESGRAYGWFGAHDIDGDGVLPRKTFSMGEAHEKRFYLECRRIVK
jgi:outer membrane protein assembly factor BamB